MASWWRLAQPAKPRFRPAAVAQKRQPPYLPLHL